MQMSKSRRFSTFSNPVGSICRSVTANPAAAACAWITCAARNIGGAVVTVSVTGSGALTPACTSAARAPAGSSCGGPVSGSYAQVAAGGIGPRPTRPVPKYTTRCTTSGSMAAAKARRMARASNGGRVQLNDQALKPMPGICRSCSAGSSRTSAKDCGGTASISRTVPLRKLASRAASSPIGRNGPQPTACAPKSAPNRAQADGETIMPARPANTSGSGAYGAENCSSTSRGPMATAFVSGPKSARRIEPNAGSI